MSQKHLVRLLKNKFYDQVKVAEQSCADAVTLRKLLGKGRAKRGMFEGDLDEGELEIGQVSACIHSVDPASKILQDIWEGFISEGKRLSGFISDLH